MNNGTVRKTSAKAALIRAARRELARRLLPAPCGFPHCGAAADDLHEPLTRGRGGDPASLDNVEPLCREHHDLVHAHPSWSRRHGWLTSASDDQDAARRKRKLLQCGTECQDCHHDD